MANFSGAVRIGDVNDFITPAQACVLNLDGSQTRKPQVPALPPKTTAALDNGWKQTTTNPNTNAIKISLQDCLACSGCVTTAETMLLQQQSTDELMQKLEDPQVTVVATLSHQSRASLAAAFGLGIAEATARLVGWLKRLGIVHVLDLHPARSIALQATAYDFVRRHRAANAAQHSIDKDALTSQEQPSAAKAPRTGGASIGAQVLPQPQLPVLASACPGWVCYAEKTHADLLLPHMSAVRSPQGVAGTLVKGVFCAQHGLDPAKTFHVAIMPCFDKKLEASRPDLTTCIPQPPAESAPSAAECCSQQQHDQQCCREPSSGGSAVPEQQCNHTAGQQHDPQANGENPDQAHAVGPDAAGKSGEAASVAETDCVIASNEVYNLMVERGTDLRTEAPARLDTWLPKANYTCGGKTAGQKQRGGPETCNAVRNGASGVRSPVDGCVRQQDMQAGDWGILKGVRGGSGGFLEYVLRHAARELHGQGVFAAHAYRVAGIAQVSNMLHPAIKSTLALQDLGDAPLTLVARRGADLQEAEVVTACGQHTLRGALVYGFRAMQNLVRRIKRGECMYDFVEVMACPSGCLNGGGQVGPVVKGQAAVQAHVRRLDELYHDRADVQLEWPEQDEVARALVTALQAQTGNSDLALALEAVFHAREKSVQGVALDW